jgi:hypothetical protein
VEYLSLLWSPLGVFFTRISTSVSVCSSICLVCCFICPEHFPRKPRGKRREWSGTYRRIPSVCLDYHQHAVSEFGKPWLPESAAVRVRCHLTLPVLLKHVWRLARTVNSSLHYTVNCLLTWPISACHSVVILQHLQFLQLLHWLCILRAWVVVGGWTSENLTVNGAETIYCSYLSDRMMQIEYLRIGLTQQMMKQELM